MQKRNFRSNRSDGSNSFDNLKGSFRGGGFSGGNREMHKATCADCGTECEVPFKPKEGRPVYCRACFANHRT